MSLWTLTFLGVRPLAAMADGALATVAGVRVATIVMTLPALLVATWMVSEFRRRRRQEDEEVPQGAAHDGDGPETLR
jgi:Na+-transporting methylmalonyl-CoA/oxaloacetate decarboxylase gamma subunit